MTSSPTLQSSIDPPTYRPHGDIPNTPFVVSLISALLGGLFISSFVLSVCNLLGVQGLSWVQPQLGIYLAAWGLFHLLEFWVTAVWNPDKLSVDAFLLNNGKAYHVAHLFGIAEFLVEKYYWPHGFTNGWWSTTGCWLIALPILVVGQILRSLAMIHAAQSFSHLVARGKEKEEKHVLVTSGIYSFSRHPSYTGFFYWALGTQLLLGNPIAFVGFAKVLGNFFQARIRDEEHHLVRFFGDDYVEYRNRVGTWLPYGLVNVKVT